MSQRVEKQLPNLSLAEKRALLAESLCQQQGSEVHISPLSFAQKRLWLLAQLEPDNPSYNVTQTLRLRGELDVRALEQTINHIIARHESLRTTFKLVDGQPVQLVSGLHEIDLIFTNLEELPEAEREAEARRLATAEARRSFDLNRDYPLRASLVRLDHDHHWLLLTIHHIASDGWSMGILKRELSKIYDAITTNQPIDLPELPVQYADFAEWQREWLQGSVLEEQLSYWKNNLAGAPPELKLPTDHPRPPQGSFQGARLPLNLSQKLSRSLSEFSQREGVTLFMTMLAAFQNLLYRYTGQEDIVVGTPIAGRNQVEIEGLIGFFVNTLALRTDCSGNPTFRQLLGRVKEVTLGAYAHQDLPFEKLVEELNPERNISQSPVFQVMFGLQNAPRETLTLPGLTITGVPISNATSKFDLTLLLTETATGLLCAFEYSTDLFEEETIVRMFGNYETLLEGIVASPEARIGNVPLLTEREKRQLLVEWNDTATEYPQNQCVHDLFAAQAVRTPDNIAVVFGDEQLTYRQLNARANQLAHFLQKRGIGPSVIVGICLDRGIDMCVSVLAVMKAGGTYLALDPSYPHERLSFMLQDAGAKVLLTNTQMREYLPGCDGDTILLDTEWKSIANESEDSLSNETTAENALYVIFTSGSTGRPKGVVMPHRALTNLLAWQLDPEQGLGAARTLQFASLSFDISFQEMFSTWCSGGTLVLVTSEMMRDAPAMLRFISEQKIERCFFPFVYLQHLAEAFQVGAVFQQHLRDVITAGEQLEITPQIAGFFNSMPECRLHNHYGPSEGHVVTAYMLPRRVSEWRKLPPIGKPIYNTRIYIVDFNGEPVPVGVAGELCVGGACLAQGYLNRAESTAEKFIPDGFSDVRGGRLYRTGDLARYRADGQIEYLGRIDNQLKISGFRVELGEIETILMHHPQVREAAVVAPNETKGERKLVAYVVTLGDQVGLGRELRKFLKQHLPEYMVPSTFVLVEQLPLTPSGKINRRALPLIKGEVSETRELYVAPRTPVEKKLAEIWSTILQRDSIGIHDNFFDLGGHSMLAVKLMAEIEKVFDVKIPLVSLFQGSTIEYLAGLLRQNVASMSWPTLIEIQAGDSKSPLFCVSHPNVNALGYRSLAHYLGPNQSVFGLQAQYPEDLDGEYSQELVDQLATEYLHSLRAVRPKGPYQFVGVCRGAHIVYEMARRLEQEGQHVALVGILDTWVAEDTYNVFYYVNHYADRLVWLTKQGFRNKLSFIKKKARGALMKSGGNISTPVRLNGTNRKRNPLHEIYFPGPDFVPRTYNGRVVVFRVRRQPRERIRDSALGWGRLALGGVDVHFIPGDHVTVLKEPYVQGLATELKKHLLSNSE